MTWITLDQIPNLFAGRESDRKRRGREERGEERKRRKRRGREERGAMIFYVGGLGKRKEKRKTLV